jgi:hypothetical protein
MLGNAPLPWTTVTGLRVAAALIRNSGNDDYDTEVSSITLNLLYVEMSAANLCGWPLLERRRFNERNRSSLRERGVPVPRCDRARTTCDTRRRAPVDIRATRMLRADFFGANSAVISDRIMPTTRYPPLPQSRDR